MALTNENLLFQGKKIAITGPSIKVGQPLPPFKLTGTDMGDVTNGSFANKVLIISVVPSLDTPVCSTQTKTFNQEAQKLSNDVVVLTVSRDLPFAQKRWCGAEGASRVVTASDYKHRTFGAAFGVDAHEMGLLARSVFVADKHGVVQHVEYVNELPLEPDYHKALAVAKELAA